MLTVKQAAMQAALDGLESIVNANPRRWQELSEPVSEFERWAKSRANHIALKLRALLAQPVQVEPVAWLVDVADFQNQYCVTDEDDAQLIDDCTNHNAKVTPLYATPQQPDTELQLAANLLQEYGLQALDVVEAFKQQPDIQAEPVGFWQGQFSKDGGATLYEEPQVSMFGLSYRNIPLYATPQQPANDLSDL